jgi:hypothetical protein
MNIMSGIKAKALFVALVTLAAGSAFGYWSYAGYQQREQRELRDEVAALVQDTSARLRAALAIQPDAVNPENPEALRSFYEHAVAVDGHLSKLRNLDASSLGHFADAADDYLLTSREILLRRASSQRYRLKFAGNLQNLHRHMRADNRTGAWITEAIRAKERVEEDYRDYRIASTALGGLLQSLPAAQAKIAPHVGATLLIDDNIVNEAHQRVTMATRDTMRELDRYANLNSYR